ncbi:MAG: EAL domain-containing protein [Clostridia bacterium]|nr:EAL domain-containing protein [Clostridia bacterium]
MDTKYLQDNLKEISDFTLTLLHSNRPIVETIKAYPDGERLTKLAVELESMLIDDVRNDKFDIFYQPKHTSQNEATSAEALFRTKGEFFVRPDVAFYLFKICKHEKEVVLKQIERVSKDLKSFTNEIDKDYNVSINIALDCLDPELVQKINSEVSKNGISHKNLGIEILESENFENVASHKELIEGLQSKGVKFALDDFGTQNSNIQALKTMNFDTIKIDASYLKEARATNDYSKIIRLEQALKTKYPNSQIVVEGVENEIDYNMLKSSGVPQLYQGYHFAKPMPAKDVLTNYKAQEMGQ